MQKDLIQWIEGKLGLSIIEMANIVSNICLSVVLAPKPESTKLWYKRLEENCKVKCGILRKVLGVAGANTPYAKT
jgi:hypothetical protein